MDETATRPENVLRVVGARFKTAGAIYDFDANGLDVSVGDRVIVEAERGIAMATIATPTRDWIPEGASGRPPRVLRRADDHDFTREDENRRREQETHRWLRETILSRRLPMKLVKVEYGLDGSKATVYFFAENRIDFRELVRDVAQYLRMRVEMKQIGARDETKTRGGSRTVRPRALLFLVAAGVPRDLRQDGQGAGPLAQPFEARRHVRAPQVLLALRVRDVLGAQARTAAGWPQSDERQGRRGRGAAAPHARVGVGSS